MPAVNRQEPDIHPAVSSRAVHLPDGNDFGTGTFTTALAPNALTATETIESLIMLPPNSSVGTFVVQEKLDFFGKGFYNGLHDNDVVAAIV